MPGGTVTIELTKVRPGHPRDWTAYVVGSSGRCARPRYDVPGADVYLTSEVPVGAGLASSAALACAVGAALSDVAGLDLLDDDRGRTVLADACRRAENEIAGAPTGGLDQTASLRCREGYALLLDFRDGRAEPVPFDLDGAGWPCSSSTPGHRTPSSTVSMPTVAGPVSRPQRQLGGRHVARG